MGTEKNYIECEMKYILDDGYDPRLAAEICAQTKGWWSDEESELSALDESDEE